MPAPHCCDGSCRYVRTMSTKYLPDDSQGRAPIQPRNCLVTRLFQDYFSKFGFQSMKDPQKLKSLNGTFIVIKSSKSLQKSQNLKTKLDTFILQTILQIDSFYVINQSLRVLADSLTTAYLMPDNYPTFNQLFLMTTLHAKFCFLNANQKSLL